MQSQVYLESCLKSKVPFLHLFMIKRKICWSVLEWELCMQERLKVSMELSGKVWDQRGLLKEIHQLWVEKNWLSRNIICCWKPGCQILCKLWIQKSRWDCKSIQLQINNQRIIWKLLVRNLGEISKNQMSMDVRKLIATKTEFIQAL
jgi:hypothetical protein